jgi:hypothetical protein
MSENFVQIRSQFGTHYLSLPVEGEPLSEEAQFAFIHGQCHAFAIALHMLTGWQIVADDDFLGRAKGHILVRMPDGKGVVDAYEIEEDNPLFQPITPKDIFNAYRKKYRGWLKPNVRAALPFAKARLAELRSENA